MFLQVSATLLHARNFGQVEELPIEGTLQHKAHNISKERRGNSTFEGNKARAQMKTGPYVGEEKRIEESFHSNHWLFEDGKSFAGEEAQFQRMKFQERARETRRDCKQEPLRGLRECN